MIAGVTQDQHDRMTVAGWTEDGNGYVLRDGPVDRRYRIRVEPNAVGGWSWRIMDATMAGAGPVGTDVVQVAQVAMLAAERWSRDRPPRSRRR